MPNEADVTQLHLIDLQADGCGGLTGQFRWAGQIYDFSAKLKFSEPEPSATLVLSEEGRVEVERLKGFIIRAAIMRSLMTPEIFTTNFFDLALAATESEPLTYATAKAALVKCYRLDGVDQNNPTYVLANATLADLWRAHSHN